MRFLLVNPWIYDFKAYDGWLKPLGLLYIAALLHARGHQVDWLDCLDRHHPLLNDSPKPPSRSYGCGKYLAQVLPKPDLYRCISRKYKRYGLPWPVWEQALEELPKPDIIMVTSAMTYWYPGAFAAVAGLKARWPDTPVLLGGIYPRLCYPHALEFSGADWVTAGWICPGEAASLRPAYGLYSRLDYAVLLTSWGCPFRCQYCAARRLSPEFIQRPSGEVTAEIAYYARELQVRDLAFYDDALLVNPENHIKPILRAVRTWGLRFHTPNALHPRYIDAELAGLMFEAGFKTVRLGVESLNPEHQEHYSSGKIHLRELELALKHLKAAGFTREELGVYLMTGLPGQGYDELKAAILWVRSQGAQCKLNAWSPVPGTPLGDAVLTAAGLQSEPLAHNNAYYLYHNPEMSFERLQELITLAKAPERAVENHTIRT